MRFTRLGLPLSMMLMLPHAAVCGHWPLAADRAEIRIGQPCVSTATRSPGSTLSQPRFGTKSCPAFDQPQPPAPGAGKLGFWSSLIAWLIVATLASTVARSATLDGNDCAVPPGEM